MIILRSGMLVVVFLLTLGHSMMLMASQNLIRLEHY